MLCREDVVNSNYKSTPPLERKSVLCERSSIVSLLVIGLRRVVVIGLRRVVVAGCGLTVDIGSACLSSSVDVEKASTQTNKLGHVSLLRVLFGVLLCLVGRNGCHDKVEFLGMK